MLFTYEMLNLAKVKHYICNIYCYYVDNNDLYKHKTTYCIKKAGNKIYFLPYKYINIKPAYFKTTLKLFHFHQ